MPILRSQSTSCFFTNKDEIMKQTLNGTQRLYCGSVRIIGNEKDGYEILSYKIGKKSPILK